MNPATPTFWRIVLIDGVLFLVLFVLAFVSLTFLGRALAAGLSARDSLIGRLSGSVLLAAVATTPAVFFNLFIFTGGPVLDTGAVDDYRNQTILGLVAGVALAAAAVFRVESYHRRLISVGPKADDWSEEGGALRNEPPRPKTLRQ